MLLLPLAGMAVVGVGLALHAGTAIRPAPASAASSTVSRPAAMTSKGASPPPPTATPIPSLPSGGAVMQPVVNHGVAPVRKPGTPDPNPSTDHVIVVDGDSGAVLFQRNADEPVAPASLTKIMTAIVALEHGNLSDQVKIDVDARLMAGDSLMGLQPGFDVTFKDLLYGLLLPSGDDAAIAIGRYVAGSDQKFVQMMNEKARWLGLKNTHFANPHGLDAPGHYSSPADMVAMARYAMQYPEFRKIVQTESYQIAESNVSYTIYNVNPLLGQYQGLDGVKTGFTDNAGKALVATAVRNGHRVYVAYMRSQDGALVDGTMLLNWAFDSFVWPDTGSSPNAGS